MLIFHPTALGSALKMHVLPTNVSLPQDHPMPDMSCVYGQSRLGHTYNSWSGAFIEGYAAVFLGY